MRRLRETCSNRIVGSGTAEEWSETEIRRVLRPGILLYLSFLCVIYYATDYSREHPRVFWICSALVVLISVTRLVLLCLPQTAIQRETIRRRALLSSVLASGAVWGALLSITLLLYKLTDLPSLLMLVCTVGTTTGAITAFSPKLTLLFPYLVCLLLPSVAVELQLADKGGKPIAAMTLLFFSFLVWQGRGLNRLYRQNSRDQWLLSKRAEELAQVNLALARENTDRLTVENALVQSNEQLSRHRGELEIRVLERTTELERAKRAAEIANAAKSEFLARMSHEIRTPMHGVLGMAHLAETADCSGEVREYLADIETSARSLLDIINDVLDFSKIEARKMAIETKPFSLERCIQECVRNLSSEADRKGVPVFVEVDTSLPKEVFGDVVRMKQILINLIHNAIKFTELGQITIRVAQEGLFGLHISVRDTGCGIAAEKQSSIFEAFTQADSSTTRQFGGSGLGLTISGQLVQLMHGRIWVESILGEGSTFHVTLPLLKEESFAATTSAH